MPIYEYRCKKCGKTFEVLQRVGAGNDDLSCPECGSAAPEKLVSMFASGGNEDSFSGSSCSSRAGFT
ncbi:MAG: zinc ribbon domain-containing protein [Calditrichaeota bacterium]|nr:MAG: zinc ribbon domain-containing protein [Calditrichota bacterium]